MENTPRLLPSYPRHRPDLRPAPFLPMSRAEMDALGWDACDVILVTGDAYIDHPSFGMALVGRALEAQGFRVGIISQPDWHSAEPFRALGRPRLFVEQGAQVVLSVGDLDPPLGTLGIEGHEAIGQLAIALSGRIDQHGPAIDRGELRGLFQFGQQPADVRRQQPVIRIRRDEVFALRPVQRLIERVAQPLVFARDQFKAFEPGAALLGQSFYHRRAAVARAIVDHDQFAEAVDAMGLLLEHERGDQGAQPARRIAWVLVQDLADGGERLVAFGVLRCVSRRRI